MLSVSAMADTTVDNSSSNESGCTKRGREGEDIKDEAYWERRRKNNESTKLLEDEIAILAAFLEQENLKPCFKLGKISSYVKGLFRSFGGKFFTLITVIS